METRDDDPPKEALRRLIGCAEGMPPPCRGNSSCHFYAARGRFSVLRRLGVESVFLLEQERRVEISLLLEVGALTMNQLIALAEAFPGPSFTRQSFFNLMHSQVEAHREMDATWPVRTQGVQSLVAACRKLGLLERIVLLASGSEEIAIARREAADCAVYIGFFIEALRRRLPGWRASG